MDLKQRLRRVNALAPITNTQRAQVPLDDLLGLRGFELETVEGVVSVWQGDIARTVEAGMHAGVRGCHQHSLSADVVHLVELLLKRVLT